MPGATTSPSKPSSEATWGEEFVGSSWDGATDGKLGGAFGGLIVGGG